ncbi:MAG: PAS domain S-box protein [Gammaproteobacteria bacterium]|nr:PAS domain S-box protein [Gammaproteobacteria bacterium]MCP4091055.1 PAS domain S-box protein [Gammaproteobacteria bacterium]MCP4277419.1 PAS domain S-box protein [Gammaproteobacteria bacterium]MCP4831520.1 PAS domain S-box protein [Gammaproteobacteria bacterium]MCP4927743.1 PAS domain S-box protein [Gammaproteobacteria bacterium]
MTETTQAPIEPSGAVQLDPVLDAMVESMIVIDEQGLIERINKATTDMFGYTTEELVGQSIGLLMTGPDKSHHVDYLERYRKTGKKRIIGKGREVQAQRKDGTKFPADIAVGEVRSGKLIRFVGLIRDLTEHRQVEEQALRQREEMVNVSRLSMMGEMAAAMAHELNQPLTAIANYAAASIRLLKQNKDSHEDILGALEEIVSQTHRAGEVIRRTRNFTKSGEAINEGTSLKKIAAQIRSLAELDTKANNIRLNWNILDDLPPINVNSVQIQQVILNLIRNAVDAMQDTPPDKRIITVRAKLTAPQQIRLEVRDEGSGVSENAAKDIFNTFFTTKTTGMGMGLAICRTIVRTHGGELGFHNNNRYTSSEGATFFFTIPTQVNR